MMKHLLFLFYIWTLPLPANADSALRSAKKPSVRATPDATPSLGKEPAIRRYKQVGGAGGQTQSTYYYQYYYYYHYYDSTIFIIVIIAIVGIVIIGTNAAALDAGVSWPPGSRAPPSGRVFRSSVRRKHETRYEYRDGYETVTHVRRHVGGRRAKEARTPRAPPPTGLCWGCGPLPIPKGAVSVGRSIPI